MGGAVLFNGWGNRVWPVVRMPEERSLWRGLSVRAQHDCIWHAQHLRAATFQRVLPVCLTTCCTCRVSHRVAHEVSGPLSCQGAFWGWKDRKQYLAQHSTVYTEFLRNTSRVVGRGEKGFLTPTLLIQRNSAFMYIIDGEFLWKKVLLLKECSIFKHNFKNAAHDLAECNLFL